MISFSTCWNSYRHTEGLDLVDEILQLGFNSIEISHGLKISLLPGLKKAFLDKKMRVSGVHNFCPSPIEVLIDAPDCYEFTSHRPIDRKRALDLTLATLETAIKFEAEYVVLHLGSIPMRRISPQLEELLQQNKGETKKYLKKKAKLLKKREKLAPLYIERAHEALSSIATRAAEVGVKIAVESRSAFEDVPNENELIEIMKEFEKNPWVGYWHDFGHVQRKHNLGLLDHEEWLIKMAPYLIGCHLHDVKWPARDHQVPLSGEIDFDRLMPCIANECPVVWELSNRREPSEIKDSLAQWRSRY